MLLGLGLLEDVGCRHGGGFNLLHRFLGSVLLGSLQ